MGSAFSDVMFCEKAWQPSLLRMQRDWPVEENVNMIELVGERNILEKGKHEKENEMREEQV